MRPWRVASRHMRALMKLLAVFAALALVAGACGNDDETDPGDTTEPETTTTTEPSDTTEPETTTTTEDEAETTAVSVYFLDGENLKVGFVRQVEVPGVAAGALEELLAGPNSDDDGLGLTSAIPDGTELLGVNIVDTLATVDLSSEFESGGGTLSMNARLAQVVYTVTQFPSVELVRIHLDGEPADALGGEGLMIDRELTRADFEFGGDYETLAPAILVESPRPGEEVSGSIRVTGRSNTFEATLNFEVVDPAGDVVIEETFTTATSGTGTPGDFDATLDLPADASGDIILLAFERSARDGERINISEVPLTVAG
jgi:germination protein M